MKKNTISMESYLEKASWFSTEIDRLEQAKQTIESEKNVLNEKVDSFKKESLETAKSMHVFIQEIIEKMNELHGVLENEHTEQKQDSSPINSNELSLEDLSTHLESNSPQIDLSKKKTLVSSTKQSTGDAQKKRKNNSGSEEIYLFDL